MKIFAYSLIAFLFCFFLWTFEKMEMNFGSSIKNEEKENCSTPDNFLDKNSLYINFYGCFCKCSW